MADVPFEAQTRGSVGNEKQIAAALLDEGGEPTVEAERGGGVRESYVAIAVEVADNAIEFWGFGQVDSNCPGRVYDGGERESRYREGKRLGSKARAA